jgi:putative holliday junction resolvase
MGASLQSAETKKARVTKAKDARGEVTLPGRILALDYGRRRIGVAVSDELRITARPLSILERKNRGDSMRKIREIAREWGARLIVVGHPLHLDGTAGEMAEEAARFANRVRKELGIEVEMVDERLSSWAADQIVTKVRRGGRQKDRGRDGARETNDDVAAAIFLRDYLERVPFHRRSTRADKE